MRSPYTSKKSSSSYIVVPAALFAAVILSIIVNEVAEDLGFPLFSLVAGTGRARRRHKHGSSCKHHHGENHVEFMDHIEAAAQTTGATRTCPCCGWVGPKFDFYGSGGGRDDARCPYCGALERHRNTCAFLGSHPEILDVEQEENQENDELRSNALRFLHFSPHVRSANTLDESTFNVDQIWVDSDQDLYNGVYAGKRPSTKTLHGDLSNLEFPDNFAHAIMVLNVLQRYADVDVAIDELSRVLKPNGWLFAEVPMISFTLNNSVECKKLKTAEEQRKCGGGPEHHWSFAKKHFEKLLAEKFDCRETSEMIKDRAGIKAYQVIQVKTDGRVVPQYFCRNKK